MHSRFLFLDWRCFGISNVTHQLNEEIRDKEIRLIGDTGEQLGIMSAAEALNIAEERGLDLVKISPQAQPPVCKLMNYGKFKFEQSKREKEAKKNQHVVEIKEVRNWRSKGHLAPLMRPTKFPEIPVSLERNPEVFRHPLL